MTLERRVFDFREYKFVGMRINIGGGMEYEAC